MFSSVKASLARRLYFQLFRCFTNPLKNAKLLRWKAQFKAFIKFSIWFYFICYTEKLNKWRSDYMHQKDRSRVIFDNFLPKYWVSQKKSFELIGSLRKRNESEEVT